MTKEQVIAADRAAQLAEPVSPLAPFTFDGDMREKRLAVGVGFDNRSLRLVPFTGDKEDGAAQSVPLDGLALMTVADAWAQVGTVVLRKLAAMHPDSFRPFPSFAPLLVG